jgi:DNA-binding response OmpR family regulator
VGGGRTLPRVIDAPARILVVDDDPTVSEVVARYLERDGYAVETLADGRAALDRALAEPPDLVVLDLMLPGIDGLEVCRRLRAIAPVPIVILTARGQESDRIIGLELGADDYVSKPFSTKELVARVRAVLRRARGPLAAPGAAGGATGGLAAGGAGMPRVHVDGDLEVDVAAREARLGGEPVALTAREFELLAFLVRHPRVAFAREEILEHVWGYRYGDTSTVTVHVRRLREKVEPDPANPVRIATVWGVGYRWEGTAGAGDGRHAAGRGGS